MSTDRICIATFLLTATISVGVAVAQTTGGSDTPKKPDCSSIDSRGFNPAGFIYIFEDTKARGRITVYDPPKPPDCGGTRLSVDAESAILVVPKIPTGSDLSLNKLFISAVLTSGDKKQNLEVVGYSEVGKDKATAPAQQGVAFRTAEDLEKMIINMAIVSGDILRYAYQIPPDKSLYSPEALELMNQTNQTLVSRAKERIALYKPEIQAIGNFLPVNKTLAWYESSEIGCLALIQLPWRRLQSNTRMMFGSPLTTQAKMMPNTMLLLHYWSERRL